MRWTMYEVQNVSNSECCTPSSEPFRSNFQGPYEAKNVASPVVPEDGGRERSGERLPGS
jgi:hypothetical protein